MDTYALLADGTTVEIRLATPEDFDAVKAMHAAMSPDNIYLRFFSFSPLSAENEAERICRAGAPGRVALLALAAGEVVPAGGRARPVGPSWTTSAPAGIRAAYTPSTHTQCN
jgi:hypothetical protein